MDTEIGRVCPVERAGSLDNKLRKLFQNPVKILSPYLKEGMKVLDIGCGPGFFSLEIAKTVGSNGKVFAVDVQEGMLQKLKGKIKDTSLEETIFPLLSDDGDIPVTEKIDFVLAFYMVHEVTYKKKFFVQIHNILDADGKMLIVEPKFHVKPELFDKNLKIAEEEGFIIEKGPKIPFSLSAILRKDDM